MKKTIHVFFVLFLSLLLLGKVLSQRPKTTPVFLEKQEEIHLIQGDAVLVSYEADREMAEVVQRMADSFLPMIEKDFQWQPKEKPMFVLCETKNSMSDFLGGFPTGKSFPMGVYGGGKIAILSPRLYPDAEVDWQATEILLERGPIVHELIHMAVDEKTGGNYPLWFTEGVALYFENKYTGFEWCPTLEHKAKQVSRSQLTEEFFQKDQNLAYRKSYEIIRDFVGVKGEEALLVELDVLKIQGESPQ